MIMINSPSAATIQLPASKSIGARFLVSSFFAGTLCESPEFDDCDDLRVIRKALVTILDHSASPSSTPCVVDVHASGTAFRFITAVAASVAGGDFIITGTPRLCSRPMKPLLEVLRRAGASVIPLGSDGCGPYRVSGTRLHGGTFEIRGDVSSQFVSALMLVAPLMQGGMRLLFTTPPVSRPYIDMTASVMERFGICVALSGREVSVGEGCYLPPAGFRVEADWSAAGFFYEAASMLSTPVRVEGLTPPEFSLQGDAATASFFALLGCVSEFTPEGVMITRKGEYPDAVEADLTDNPDLAPAFLVACVLTGVRCRLTGVANLRLKESDRLAALSRELLKLGYVVETGDDYISWNGEETAPSSEVIEVYDDHRIAMAFAMVALRRGRVSIADPGVVDKSFTDFWTQAARLGLRCSQASPSLMNIEYQP